MVVRVENYDKLSEELERQEIIKGGILSNVDYAKLLAIYLYQNDLIAAKFLWKRISLATKSAMPELEAIWNVGKAMKRKDYPEIFSALKYSWSTDVIPIMQMAEEEIRHNTLKLIAKSYSSLEIEKLCRYIGCDSPTALSIAEKHGWRNDGTFVFPLRGSLFEDVQDNRSEFNAFEKLTDSISFLEN